MFGIAADDWSHYSGCVAQCRKFTYQLSCVSISIILDWDINIQPSSGYS